MNCQKCNADTEVIDSRLTDQGGSVRRRRRCQECGHRFTTIEEDIDRSQEICVTVSSKEIARAITNALRHQKTVVVVRGFPTSRVV